MAGKSLLTFFVIAGLLVLFSLSCENNNEKDLYGEQSCDTTDITWDSKVSAIMAKKCVSCHGEDLSYNGVRHDSYEYEMIVIKDGRLRGVINHLDGFARMPKDLGKLPECELKTINIWLDNGAPEK